MKVLIVGSGGREHALAWRIRRSPRLTRLWVAGGNAGTASIAENVAVSPEDVPQVLDAARRLSVDLVAVGPEVPLARGLVDRLAEAGIPAFGPTAAAAQIEASKGFARQLMQEAGVPSPQFRVFSDLPSALDMVQRHHGPLVVKADGLAAGKGVTLCASPAEAAQAVQASMTGQAFGAAGQRVVIEEMLQGPEVSVFAFCDGQHLSALTAACDYKRLADGDQGPNTGGMGSFSPPPLWDESLAGQVKATIMQPVVQALAQRGTPYRGVLYAGLMLTTEGPKVLEFNCRLGDPETQVVLPLLETDPLELMLACVQGQLDRTAVKWDSQRACVGVVMASGGYPGKYATGVEITGLGQDDDASLVFHAGTRLEGAKIVTSGGRVLTIVGMGESLEQARFRAYQRTLGTSFPGACFRRDIAASSRLQGDLNWALRPAAAKG